MARPLQNLILGALSFVPLLSLGVVVVYLYRRPSLAGALESAGNISPQLYAGPGGALYVGAVGLVCGLVLYMRIGTVCVLRRTCDSNLGNIYGGQGRLDHRSQRRRSDCDSSSVVECGSTCCIMCGAA